MRTTLLLILLLLHSFLPAQSDSVIDPAQSFVLSVLNKVESEDRIAGNMDPNQQNNLPIGIVKEIGATRYIIAIDSAEFHSANAQFSAYMALEFPGSTQKICFEARDIGFNPKGVMPGPQSKLLLVSEHRISLGPKVTMVLKPDGYNYVEWDCNGFEAVNLKGYFEFDPGMIYPDPSAAGSDSVVRASFQIHTGDIHNFIVQTAIAPFCIRGVKDLSFSVLDATADFSELANAPNMNFPQGYDLANCNGDPLVWTGFYMRQFRVKLPKELGHAGVRPEILASNLLIDNSGVSGSFSATNLITTKTGSMNGWGFSVNSIGVSLCSNQVNGGNMSGYIDLPICKNDSLQYAALLSENLQTHELDYAFAISPSDTMHAEVLCASLKLLPTSHIAVIKTNGKLKPTAILNGNFTLNNTNAKAKGLEFQQLTLSSDAPVLQSGTFSLVSAFPQNSSLAGFGYSLSEVTVGNLNAQPAIRFKAGMNFTDGDTSGFNISVQGGFTVMTQTETVNDPNGEGNATKVKWEFDRVRVDNVSIACNTSNVHLNGGIAFMENDPVYGNGFSGSISMSIEKVLPTPATSRVWFGRANGVRYFYVDASVPATFPVTGGISIYRFMGGLYYHMHRQGNTQLENQLYSSNFGSSPAYIPDPNASLGIRAGVTLGTTGNPRPCNGDVALEIAFNTNGGVDFLRFDGTVYFMTSVADRQGKLPAQLPAVASMVALFDFQNNAIHAVMAEQIHVPGISSSGQAVIHFDPQTWYIYIGRPQNRVNVSVVGVANLSAYFETGSVVDPMPPPPSQVTSVVTANGLNDQRDENALQNAGGFLFGAGMNMGFTDTIGFDHFGIYFSIGAGAGFDIMILDYGSHVHCQNSTDVVGFNGWVAGGQVYAYLQGAVGLECEYAHTHYQFTILSLSAAAILQTRLPNPSWVGGAVGCDYDVLGGVISGHVDLSFDTGEQCAIVQN
ncbi:MAG TPA: hypothetical protein VL651_00630 [Bacteroidia bacterium]|jgi:hypothetical protein|nr:hypothetical protein [Bacteroidia bacterium]